MVATRAAVQTSSHLARYTLPLAGAVAIALASLVRIDLPFTPVPITGQTFAVVLWGLLFGSRQGASAAIAYLAAGALGAPVFAGFMSLTALWGPTAGYLIGFIPGAYVAGFLMERGFTNTVSGTFVASVIAAVPIFVFGTPVLAAFVGWDMVLTMGVVPFVAGLAIKSTLATAVVSLVQRTKRD